MAQGNILWQSAVLGYFTSRGNVALVSANLVQNTTFFISHDQEKSDGAAQLCALRFTVTVSEALWSQQELLSYHSVCVCVCGSDICEQ